MALDNDFTGEYLESRERANTQDLQSWASSFTEDEPAPTPEPEINVRKEIGRGASEILSGKAIASGLSKAASATLSLGEDIDNFLLEQGIDTGVFQFTNPETGEFDPEFVSREEFNQRLADADVENKLKTLETESIAGGAVAAITQFLAGFAGAGKFIKAKQGASSLAKLGTEAAKGAVADFTVFEGQEQRLADLIQSVPALENPVTEFLTGGEDESALEGRLLNALEGLGLGALVEPVFQAVKGVRNANVARVERKQLEAAKEDALKLAEIEPEMKKLELGDKEAPAFTVKTRKIVDDSGEPAGKEKALNINLSKLDTTDDVKQVIENVGKKFSGEINEARREKQTFELTEQLADDLGMSVEKLLDRRKGQAFNAEELLASRKILLSSGEQLTNLAREITQKGEDAGASDLITFQRAMNQHRAIQAQVSGATAEAGRALSQFRIEAKSAREQEQLINEALNTTGGRGVTLDAVRALSMAENPQQVNAMSKGLAGATTREMVYEAWINGLLTNPATHTANIIGNTLTLATQPAERKLASMIGRIAGDPEIPTGESRAQLYGMVSSFNDALNVAAKTFKTGEPSSQIQKIENQQRKAITSENVQAALQGSKIGQAKKKLTGQDLEIGGNYARAIDFYGEYVARMPGRLLAASDDFFQLIGYRMELHAQAYRQASAEGLEGPAFTARVNDIINDPPDNIHSRAVDAQHYATFTDELGPQATAISKGIASIPAGRVFMPFMRTPFNILGYAMERQPLAPVTPIIGKQIREDIAAGGARRDMALAKMAAGSMVMAMGAELEMAGIITGSGPSEFNSRKIWEIEKRPYSIRIGNEWFSYNRFDPIAVTLANAADITQVIGELEEADAFDLAMQGTLATAQNMISKNYLQGISGLLEALSSARVDPDAKNTQVRRVVEGIIGSLVPSGVAAITRINDPVLRSTYDPEGFQQIINRVKSRVPGYSDELPPRRNIFAEPVVLEGGLGPDIMSPVWSKKAKDDPTVLELIRVGVPLRMPSKTVSMGGARVELTAEEYDRLLVLTGKEIGGKDNLKKAFSKLQKTREYKQATDGPDGMKATMLQKIYLNYKQAAKAQLLKESEGEPDGLIQRIQDKQAEQIELLGG